MSLQDFFTTLPGQWQLVRHANDGTSWTGKAQIEQLQEDKLLYEEAVESGESVSGFQRHVIRWQGGKVLFFEAARPSDSPFLTLNGASEGKYAGQGICGQDHYRATYTLENADSWQVSYTVNGPKKDYQLHTVYKRLL